MWENVYGGRIGNGEKDWKGGRENSVRLSFFMKKEKSGEKKMTKRKEEGRGKQKAESGKKTGKRKKEKKINQERDEGKERKL